MRKPSAKVLAHKVYHSPAVQDIFEAAYGLFPRYNEGGDDTYMACDYICDRAMDEAARELGVADLESRGKKYAQAVRDELYEAIHAGLT